MEIIRSMANARIHWVCFAVYRREFQASSVNNSAAPQCFHEKATRNELECFEMLWYKNDGHAAIDKTKRCFQTNWPLRFAAACADGIDERTTTHCWWTASSVLASCLLIALPLLGFLRIQNFRLCDILQSSSRSKYYENSTKNSEFEFRSWFCVLKIENTKKYHHAYLCWLCHCHSYSHTVTH